MVIWFVTISTFSSRKRRRRIWIIWWIDNVWKSCLRQIAIEWEKNERSIRLIRRSEARYEEKERGIEFNVKWIVRRFGTGFKQSWKRNCFNCITFCWSFSWRIATRGGNRERYSVGEASIDTKKKHVGI